MLWPKTSEEKKTSELLWNINGKLSYSRLKFNTHRSRFLTQITKFNSSAVPGSRNNRKPKLRLHSATAQIRFFERCEHLRNLKAIKLTTEHSLKAAVAKLTRNSKTISKNHVLVLFIAAYPSSAPTTSRLSTYTTIVEACTNFANIECHIRPTYRSSSKIACPSNYGAPKTVERLTNARSHKMWLRKVAANMRTQWLKPSFPFDTPFVYLAFTHDCHSQRHHSPSPILLTRI